MVGVSKNVALMIPSAPRNLYASRMKRLIDVSLAAVAVVILLPLMGLVALAVLCVLGPPVFFCDERAGLNGCPIQVVKFRSMSNSKDAAGKHLPDEARLGFFGRFLRRTSLDELPQLFSIIGGSMSLIGPRPLPIRYIARYSPRQAARLLVRPGLTGWAQVNGRNAVAWPERLELDARYVEMLGRPGALFTDCWIVGLTMLQLVSQAITGRGIASPGSATMQEFAP